MHLLPHGLVEFGSRIPATKPTIAERDVGGAKGVGRVGGRRRPPQGRTAHVGRVDPELVWGEAGFEERDGDRIGLFAGGAGHAQDAERGRIRPLGKRDGMLPEIIEDLLVPKEPAFWHHHFVDESLSLLRIAGDPGEERPFLGLAAGVHSDFHGAGDGTAADRLRIKPDPLLQERLGKKACLGSLGGNRMGRAGMHGRTSV